MMLVGEKVFTSDDVSMLGNGCSVSQYTQFYDQHLEKYQLIPHSYLRSFEGHNGEKTTKQKIVLDLSGGAEMFLGLY